MNVTVRYGNQLLVDGKPLWARMHLAPKTQEIMQVGPDDIRTITAIGQTVIAEVLAKYPEAFVVGLQQDAKVRYASPSPFTYEGYVKTTGLTTDMADIHPAFHDYWRAVENEGKYRAFVRMGADATWLMLGSRQ